MYENGRNFKANQMLSTTHLFVSVHRWFFVALVFGVTDAVLPLWFVPAGFSVGIRMGSTAERRRRGDVQVGAYSRTDSTGEKRPSDPARLEMRCRRAVYLCRRRPNKRDATCK